MKAILINDEGKVTFQDVIGTPKFIDVPLRQGSHERYIRASIPSNGGRPKDLECGEQAIYVLHEVI